MITIILGIIAFALAIPTWGMSLVIFFWIKKKYDNMAVMQILNKAKISANGGGFMTLHKINNAAIDKVYTLFGVNVYGYTLEQYDAANRAGIMRTDFHFENNIIFPSILHPDIGEIYLYLNQIEGNQLSIFAMKANT